MKRLLVLALSVLVVACDVSTPAPPKPSVQATGPTLASPTRIGEPAKPLTTTPEITLSITCRCVIGGVSANTAGWIATWVIPKFEEQMRRQGKVVKVNFVQFGGSDEELKQRYMLDLKAGQGADVIYFDGFWVPEFVSAGLLKPLDGVAGAPVNNWEGWSHIPRSVQDILIYQGKRYGIPIGTDVRAIWYRRDIFKQAGLAEPWQPRAWDELLDAARTIKKARPDVIPLQINAGTAMGEATTLQGYFMILLGAGSHVYNFDTNKWIVRGKPILDTLNFYKRIYRDEILGDAQLQLLKEGRQRSFLNFRDGKIAMLVEGDWFWRSVLTEGETRIEDRNQIVGWAKMPAQAPGKGYRGQDFVSASGGTGFTLNPNTQNPAEAWALLAFMFSQEGLAEIQKVEVSIRARDDVPVPNEPVMTALAQGLLRLTTVRPLEPAYPSVSVEIQRMTERVVSGEMTPEQAMEAYAQAITSLVGKDKVEEFK